jgi:hypothetical protein
MYDGHPCDSLRVRVQGGGRDLFSDVVHCTFALLLLLQMRLLLQMCCGHFLGRPTSWAESGRFAPNTKFIFPRAYTQAPQSLAPSNRTHARTHTRTHTHTCMHACMPVHALSAYLPVVLTTLQHLEATAAARPLVSLSRVLGFGVLGTLSQLVVVR